MFEQFKKQHISRIDEMNWMDDKTKELAKQKV